MAEHHPGLTVAYAVNKNDYLVGNGWNSYEGRGLILSPRNVKGGIQASPTLLEEPTLKWASVQRKEDRLVWLNNPRRSLPSVLFIPESYAAIVLFFKTGSIERIEPTSDNPHTDLRLMLTNSWQPRNLSVYVYCAKLPCSIQTFMTHAEGRHFLTFHQSGDREYQRSFS